MNVCIVTTGYQENNPLKFAKVVSKTQTHVNTETGKIGLVQNNPPGHRDKTRNEMKETEKDHAKSHENVTRAEALWWRWWIAGGTESRSIKKPLSDRGSKEAELKNHRADV